MLFVNFVLYFQILYYEEIRDFLPTKTIFFRCELLGLPGNYAVRLKASNTNPTAPNTSVYFKVISTKVYFIPIQIFTSYNKILQTIIENLFS